MGNGEITISFKLHMTVNDINTTLLHECHYQSLLSVCNNFWLRSSVDFGQMMRKKYVNNILEEFYVKDTQLQLLWGVKKSNVTSSVTNYCCQTVISKVTILLLKGVTSIE